MSGIDSHGDGQHARASVRRGGSLHLVARRLMAVRRERSEDRALERRLREQLRDLDVQPPLSVEELCDALARQLQRPIILRAHPLPIPGPQGLCVETAEGYAVLYQEHTTPLHQRHIILHEVMGHICGNHQADDAQWHLTVPGLSSDAVRRVVARCAYDDHQECEAERAATIVTMWAAVLDEVALAASEHPELRRVHSAMCDHHGWL
ncbi:hypothetical protein [Streptomyces sp. MNP-20]|uniref:hypothetical protein n=1 Tax=Streptomyces sp. MNP-20 TaxID=2721165 RepID=UPI0020A6A17F|nr:hypothetical protein [Streptomyces sp. MNP-20]